MFSFICSTSLVISGRSQAHKRGCTKRQSTNMHRFPCTTPFQKWLVTSNYQNYFPFRLNHLIHTFGHLGRLRHRSPANTRQRPGLRLATDHARNGQDENRYLCDDNADNHAHSRLSQGPVRKRGTLAVVRRWSRGGLAGVVGGEHLSQYG